ncbi:nitrilase-related carbon-nitrogen hydrolase [Paenirhodobacter sp.]|uniref:nitrilase-related carbon-nitrogen hydrolase n=1 Tax=Paenirhodobacter sp. TaxID=1965326 RepID=UPI003B40A24D
MSVLTVAAAQIRCIPGDVTANLRLHLDAIAAARGIGAGVLLFPELSLTDYLARPDTARLGRPVDAPEVRAIAAAAGPMRVSFGMIEAAPAGMFNTQILVGGGVCHVHRKLYLPHYGNLAEADHYTPGRHLTLAPGRLATLICADSWNPALVWLTARRAPDLLLQPIASARGAVGQGFDNPGGWELNLRHIAMIWGLPIVMCNHCGTRGGLDFWGGSRILDAFGQECARAGAGEALIHARIDLTQAQRARARLPTARDADPALIAQLMREAGLSGGE